jgi:AraC-like DNA-binding protein
MNLQSPVSTYSISFPSIDCDQDLEQLAKELNGEVVDKNVIQLSGGLAKGLIKRSQPAADCCIRTWNLLFNYPVELYKPGIRSDNKSFSVIYVLTPDSFRLKSVGGHQQFNQTEARSTLIVANDIDLRFDALPYYAVQVIEIRITTFWLARHFQQAGLPLENLLDRINEKEASLILSNICTTTVINNVNKLFEACMNMEPDNNHAGQLATSLILDFLHKAFNSQPPKVFGNHDAHFLKVMEAEAILKAHLQRNLPSVCAIAQQVSLSESTLKRHFKVIFGKNLYEYYLEKKMNLAKLLLLEQPLTVYEAANLRGYEKVSNFIWIFKKHHGFSPGSLKKRGLVNV